MNEMSAVDEMLAIAAGRAAELATPWLDSRPRKQMAILTCMDVRLDVFPMLGLELGDAHVIRNAGGLVTDDAVRSLSISQHLLGTREIIVMMHDDCGLHRASEKDFIGRLAGSGSAPSWKMGAFTDTEATLSDGIRALRSSAHLLFRDAVRGVIFDPATGVLREVVVQDEANQQPEGMR